jgi:hypothetical protein
MRYRGAFVRVLFGTARRSKLVASWESFACTLSSAAPPKPCPRSQRPPSLSARATLPKKPLRRQLPALFAEDGEGGDVVEFARLIFLSASPSPHPSRPAEGAMPDVYTPRNIPQSIGRAPLEPVLLHPGERLTNTGIRSHAGFPSSALLSRP